MKGDAALVAAVLANGVEAFGLIVERYKDAVFGVALARLHNFHDAEDITQAAFIEAFERLEHLKNPDRLGAWLRSITIHRSIDFLRRKDRVVDIDAIDELEDDSTNPQAAIEGQELRDRVMAAINRLSKVQRETVTLFYINGYSQQEVAALQEVPLGTIKYRLHEARNRLKKEMIDMVEEVLKDGAPKEDFSNRVFDLLCRYPEKRVKTDWDKMVTELRKIGTPGVEGFIRAFALPHWSTRRWTVYMLEKAPPQNTQVLIDLLKKGLKDRNKKVRRRALQALMRVDVSDERKRKEFIPLVAEMLLDRSKRVRHCASQPWILGPCAVDMPLEKVAAALKRETDPQIRRTMQNLLVRVIESKTEHR